LVWEEEVPQQFPRQQYWQRQQCEKIGVEEYMQTQKVREQHTVNPPEIGKTEGLPKL
jgi:hypothetical protein